MSSNLASVKVVVEDDDAKVADISKDVASVASQTVSSGSDLTTASAVRAKGSQDISESEIEFMEVIEAIQRVISTTSWKHHHSD